MATYDQLERYGELHDAIEAAVSDPSALGALRDDVITADLDESHRLELRGNIGTYLADQHRINDPLERPLLGDDAPEHTTMPLGDDPDAAEDAAADAEDGFAIAPGWQPAWPAKTK